MNRQEIIRKIESEIPKISGLYCIKSIAIFGSYARNTHTDISDVDLLVEYTKPIGLYAVDLKDHIEKLIKKDIDLVSLDAVDNVFLNKIKDDLIYVY